MESILRKRGAEQQEKLDKWMAAMRTDTDLTQPKVKGKHDTSNQNEPGGIDTSTLVGGEEVL